MNGRSVGSTPAGLPDFIRALNQDRQQFLLDVAAAVPALVDDQAFLVTELGQVLLELRQRRLIHRLDVQVSNPAAGELIDLLAPFFHPAVVA